MLEAPSGPARGGDSKATWAPGPGEVAGGQDRRGPPGWPSRTWSCGQARLRLWARWAWPASPPWCLSLCSDRGLALL